MRHDHILALSCPDRTGIVYRVSGLLFGQGLTLEFRLAGLLLFLQTGLTLSFGAVFRGSAGKLGLTGGGSLLLTLALLLLRRDIGFLFHLGRRRLDHRFRLDLRHRRGLLHGLLNRSLVPQLGLFAARGAALPLHAKVQKDDQQNVCQDRQPERAQRATLANWLVTVQRRRGHDVQVASPRFINNMVMTTSPSGRRA